MAKTGNTTIETKLMFRLPKSLHYELKILSANLDIPMAELCREAIKDIISKKSEFQHGKKKNNP